MSQDLSWFKGEEDKDLLKIYVETYCQDIDYSDITYEGEHNTYCKCSTCRYIYGENTLDEIEDIND